MRVCLLSSVHASNDVRIFEKEARSLSAAGHHVTIVAHNPKPDQTYGIEFCLIEAAPRPRWKRLWTGSIAAIASVRALRPDVVHFHDPELIPIALAVKLFGYRVIYDVHEDLPRDILSKRWIPQSFRPIVSRLAELFERLVAPRFDAVVAATVEIARRFESYGAKVIVVRNYVRLEEFTAEEQPLPLRPQAVYVGRISFDRGLVEMVEACKLADMRLVMAGGADEPEANWLRQHESDVTWLGLLDRPSVIALLHESSVGLCVLHPEPNYQFAIPVKLLEYMAAGLPVIASDLPVSASIVTDANCGFVISECKTSLLTEALLALTRDDADARQLGFNGKRLVRERYNWQNESVGLTSLYQAMSVS